MQKVTPFLWFDDNAEEAVQFYTSVFKNSRVIQTTRYGKDTPGPEGKVMTIAFDLEGQEFTALNGGPGVFEFTGAISFVVDCKDQAEVDYYWEKLSADPAAEQCGWLKDKFGVYWQIVPRMLTELVSDPDPAKAYRVTQAMLQMKKIDIARLQHAAENEV